MVARVSLAAVGAAVVMVLSGGSASAATYNAYDQFGIANGAITATNFDFGYYIGDDYDGSLHSYDGSLTHFSSFREAPCDGYAGLQCASTSGVPGVFKGPDGLVTGTAFYTEGFLNLHPGYISPNAVVQFIAPSAGDYNFTGSFAIHDVNPSAVYVSGVIGSTLSGGSAPFFNHILASGSYGFNFDATLGAGEKVSFLLGSYRYYQNDSTGLRLTVSTPEPTSAPEPGVWTLMILGFGAAGSMLRRRRLSLSA